MPIMWQYAVALGWALVGALSMAVSLAVLLKVFTWLTPVDEWEELRNGNVGIAIVLGAAIIAFALVVSAAIPASSVGR